MATTVTLEEARSGLKTLVDRAAGGEEIVIAEAGRPRARLVAMEGRTALPKGKRRLGGLMGQIRIGDDFDDPLPEEIARAFRGEGD